ncbi:ABC transporter ATP-binding protein [Sphingomonas sp. PAMC 26605]|uniref:ABC transporter ATP-binding protein n=1 Tax=Sphingomonas sp. PAMC 26605 TaxID=1112214 RepID=UPI00026CDD35|nr:ABC transporter ATP-binding protein [Sphingomonas sp. PAMC 26605]
MTALVRDFARFGGRKLVVAIVLMLAGGVFEGVGLAMLVPIFALLTPQIGGRWQARVHTLLTGIGARDPLIQLAVLLAVFCAMVGVRAVVLAVRDRRVSDLSLGYVDHRRLIAVTDLAHARWAALSRLEHARIGHILSSEIGRLAMACSLMLYILMASIMLAAQAVLMIVLSPLVAGLMLCLALIGVVAVLPLSRRAAIVGTSSAHFGFRIAGEAAQFLGGLKIAVVHDRVDAFVGQIARESAQLRSLQTEQQRLQSHATIAGATIAAILGAAMIFGAVLVGASTVTLLAALVVLLRMSGPVRSLQLSVQQLFGVLPAFTALRALHADLGAPAPALGDEADRGGGACLPSYGVIRFERVSFGYPGATVPVFRALDVTIAPGTTVGITGPSGAGKTTFLDLLTGLLEPGTGRISVGDVPLGPATLADWRRRLAYVAQDSYLVNDSIRRNLTWTAEPAPEADLWHALAQVGAADLVAAMPEGLDTRVEERGTRLSGGERQRIALARALLRRPALLILDEATNAVDIATERAVLANLRSALPEATILVVAHRAETLRGCARVITLAGRTAADPGVGDSGA